MPEVKRDAKGRLLKGTPTNNPGGITKEYAQIVQLGLSKKAITLKTIYDTVTMPFLELQKRATDKSGITIEILVARMFMKAMDGSLPHAQALFDRILGKVAQPVVTKDEEGNDKAIENLTVGIPTDKILTIIQRIRELPDEEPKLVGPGESS